MNQKLEFFPSKGYGVFPYIIIREMSGLYRQIPIHFTIEELLKKEGVLVNHVEGEIEESIEVNCISTLREIIRSEPVISNQRKINNNWTFIHKERLEGCVVFSPRRAVYLDSRGNFKEESKSIPWGGNLVSMCGEIIITGNRHYNLFK